MSIPDKTHTDTDPWRHTDHKYLGDGVYASFDGYQVWLRLNAHNSTPLIALEPKVLRALVEYAKPLQGGGV